MRRKNRAIDEAEINITPMLDIVFIMLIFFIVTTSFVKEKGLEVSRPSNAPPKEVKKNKGPIVVKIDSNSNISMQGRILERKAVEANLEREKAEKPDSPLIIAAHPDAETDALVTILDAAEAVGVGSVSVATTQR
ncbi:MAG: biopolymer transporter ExbD [Xanthomonadales bacterium]|jgi:biopolymer transport protein ExbD|nr:biopolymer transporter ExbD [Gammaproteobacteria bacterium]MBT8074115.1 biopolymer transporter ExbD [Gammaproteobacteria bacterium]NNK04968.1 biopolymer transporter ExbD [Xanthomonadales bacterium]NNL00131.1 biopolymer transporter ExbD [Xanthomonadales bacterium]